MSVLTTERDVAHVTIRSSGPLDLPRLIELSPPEVKPTVHFFVYATLVAEVDGVIAGYTQSSLTPDGILYSLAIRVDAAYQGQGIGQQLMEIKVHLATMAGAKMHFYALAHDGEEAIKRICLRLGMHLCQRQPGNIDIWSHALGPEAS
jgi:ribosomal protein S18 acetylase RimI-like enzyme